VFEARVINLCDRDIATNFGVAIGEVILVDSCACTVIFICCDSKKKKRETEFLLATVLFTCGSGTVQNRVFYGIRYRPFVS
jgi:predicted RNase H-related nuclease YkuK (DUF458 family)